MSYVDAIFDRNNDLIKVVERSKDKRHYKEYPARYVFYYPDQKGKYESVYGEKLSRVVARSQKDFHKELRIHNGKRLFESDINPIYRCLEENYLNQDASDLHIAFFDIETDFDPERGFADPSDPFMGITAITIYLKWLNRLVTLAVPPKKLPMEEAKKQCEEFTDCFLFEREADMLETFLDLIEDADILSGWNSEGYDIPYTVNRVARVLSKKILDASVYGINFPRSESLKSMDDS
jgi:DNA polymerase elongation subunit (family B)